MSANLGNSAVAIGLEKVSFHSNPKERQCERMLKVTHSCTHLSSVQFSSVTQSCPTLCNPMNRSMPGFPALISHASKVMLKILQARLQQYVNHELPDVQADFRKGRGTRDQIANINWIMEKARVPEKHLFLLY